MNQEIEQRIVAMYFDNKDFEKNAKETIKTLGDLRDNLNLEDSVKGFEELDKAGKKLNLTNVKQTINGMKNSLGGFSSVLNKAFTVGTAPVRSLENFFHTFQSYVGKFVGFDLASKFVNSLENALRQLTIAPVEAGWNMYQANVDSTKTIMSGTLQSYKKQMSEVDSDWTYKEEEHMEYVKQQLRELSSYAQQTVFSLTDMTNNVGKFTNNNIDLETSVIAMEGIANMTAKAGQGAQQASMAMYNFSQALGVGKMTSMDWKSIENANIATTELKQLFIDSAVAGGKLEKQVEKLADGKEIVKYFQTVDENGKKLAKNKWIEVSAENFRDTLREGWLDKQTMLNTMKIYSGKINDVDDLKAMGFDVENEELVKYLMEIGEQAALAATQVRTFSKMWDAMTEAVQSGWADSMELIFGDMTEATEFWTEINNRISGVLDASAEERNKMLHEWRGETYDEMEKAWKRVDGAYDGREDLVHGIYDVIAAARALGGTFKDAWRSVFGQTDGKKLQEITKAFHDLTSGFNQWLGGQRDKSGETRLDKIRKGLKGIFSILKTVGNVFRTVFGVISKLAAPIADTFINLFGKIGGFFDGLGELNAGQVIAKLREGMHKLWDAIVKLFSPTEIEDELGRKTGKKQSPIAHFLESTFGNIKKDVEQWFKDNDLAGVWNAIEDAWNWIKEIWEKIANWEGWAAIGAFFTNVYFAVRDYFAPKEMRRYNGSQLESYFTDSPFVASIKRIWEKVKSVWNTIVGWEGWKSIGQFLADVGGWISRTATNVWNFFTLPNADGRTEFSIWLDSVWNTIETTWHNIETAAKPVADAIWGFITNTWEWIKDAVGLNGNGKKENEVLPVDRFVSSMIEGKEAIAGQTKEFDKALQAQKEGPSEEPSPSFSEWLNGVWKGIESTWNDIKKAAEPVFRAIGNFFTDAWTWASTNFGIAWDWLTKPEDDGTTPFSKWLNNVYTQLETAWNNVVGWTGWTTIGSFFVNIYDSIVGMFSGEATNSGNAGNVISDTAGFIVSNASSIIDQVNGNEGSQVTQSSTQKAEEKVGLFERIFNAVSDFIRTVGEYLTGTDIEPVSKFFASVGTFFTGLLDIITKVLDAAGRFMTGLSKGGVGGAFGALSHNERVTVIIAAALGLLSYILDFVRSKWESKISEGESVAHKLFEIGAALLMVALALGVISLIPTEKIITGGIVLAVILAALTAFATTLANNAKINATTPTERVLNNLINTIGKIGMIAVAMALLPEIIKAFGEAKKMAPDLSGMDIMETLVGLGTFIAEVSLALALVSKLNPKGIDIGGTLKTVISIVLFLGILLAALGGIGAAVGGIGVSETVKALRDAATVLNELGAAIGGFVGTIIGSLIEPIRKALGLQTAEEQMETSLEILESLGSRMEYFTSEKMNGIYRILAAVDQLSKSVGTIPDSGKILAFAEALDPMATAIMKMGISLAGFTEQDPGSQGPKLDDVEQNIFRMADIIKAFRIPPDMNMASAIGFIDAIRTLSKEMSEDDFRIFGELVNSFVASFNEATGPNGEAMTRMSSNLMSNLTESIRIGLQLGNGTISYFDATPIVDSIVIALGLGSTSIAVAVHDMVQSGLDALGGNGGGEGGLSLTFPEILTNSANQGFSISDMFGGDIQAQILEMMYGKGGTEESPTKDSLYGTILDFNNKASEIKFPDIKADLEELKEQMTFKDEEGNIIDFPTMIQENLDKMSTALDEAGTTFEITVIPTLDWGNLTADSIQQQLNNMPVEVPNLLNITGGALKIDTSTLSTDLNMGFIQEELVAIENAIDTERMAVVEAVNSMSVRIDGVSAAVRSMRLYLDTGLLVGGITPYVDRELGRRAALASRTGVTPR